MNIQLYLTLLLVPLERHWHCNVVVGGMHDIGINDGYQHLVSASVIVPRCSTVEEIANCENIQYTLEVFD